jgi:ATP-dependent Clp protease ATP-binding subunit ClpB
MAFIVTFSLVVSAISGVVLGARNRDAAVAGSRTGHQALTKYAQDLTLLAQQGRLQATSDHAATVNRIVAMLGQAKFTQPVLVGEDRATANEVAVELAQSLASNGTPADLRNKHLYRLDVNALFDRAKTSDEIASRLKAVLTEAAAPENNAILFVDELQQFAGLRAVDAAAAELAGFLATGKLKLVGSANALAFANYVEADASVAPFFEAVQLDQAANTDDAANQPVANNSFVGDKVSPDLQDAVNNAKSPNDRVSVIL